MKKIISLSIFTIALLFSNSNCFAQRSYEMELTNLLQINETEIRFDVRIKNTAVNPVTDFIAIEGMQFQVAFNTAMLNGGGFNDLFLQYINSSSDFEPLGTKIVPASSNVTSDQTKIQWITQPLNPGEYTTYINHNNWLRIGTFKAILKANSASFDSKNFASVLSNLSLVPSGCIVNWCAVDFNVFGDGKYTRATGATPNLITNQTLSSSIINKPLYSHAFTGSGNYNDAVRWNNAVNVADASYHVVAVIPTNNISIGTLSTADQPVAVPGICILTTNQQLNDVTIQSTSTLTMNAGTQLSIDGTLYNENTTAGSLTLKANAGVNPTASLKNNTAGLAATIECYIPAWGSNIGWHLLSSPVTNQSIAPNFTDAVATNYDFYSYNPSVFNCWVNYKGGSFLGTTFVNTSGFLVSYATAGTHNFSGLMNSGNFNPTVTYFTVPPGTAWNLIGNPYACAIDGDLLIKTNVNNTVYVLDGINSNYKSWNGITGDLTNGEIPAMQGFFVESNGINPSITIPVSAKIHSATNFSKSTLDNHLRLSVQSPNTTQAVTFIYFKDENSHGIDKYDATYLPGMNPLNTQIYSYINSKSFAINALGTYTTPVTVNLGFEPKINGNFTITAGDIQSFTSASQIILQDIKTNTTQDLRINPTYHFTADSSDAIHRFNILFDFAPLAIKSNSSETNTIYSFENNIYIKSADAISSVSVYNMLGQLMENIQHPTSNVISIHQATGYYTVKVITLNSVYSQKVYIK